MSVPISLRTPMGWQILGIVVGFLAAAAAAFFAANGHQMSRAVSITVTVIFGLIGAGCGWACLIDLTEHRLPNRLTYPLIPAVMLAAIVLAIVAGQGHRVTSALMSALITGGLFFVAALIAPTGIGMGDAKLAVTTGAMAGWWSYVTAMWAIFSAFVFAGLVALALIAVRHATAKTPIAFGPFLFLGAVVAIWWNVAASPFSW
ncbi:prepilin peptidase [Bowdeniella nasicola]|nr:A24 family peptidase [Bowdeniella nasicola]